MYSLVAPRGQKNSLSFGLGLEKSLGIGLDIKVSQISRLFASSNY